MSSSLVSTEVVVRHEAAPLLLHTVSCRALLLLVTCLQIQCAAHGVPGWRQDDHSRLEQLRAHTSRAGHIYRNFSW